MLTWGLDDLERKKVILETLLLGLLGEDIHFGFTITSTAT